MIYGRNLKPPARNFLLASRMRSLLSLMHKRFLSSSPSSSSSSSSTVECLVNSCGLPSKSALEFSRDFHLHENNLQSFQSVFRCFQSYNIPSIRITKLIKRRPQILNYNVEDNLKPKLQLLVQNGIVGHHMCKVFVSNPLILNADLDSQIKPCFQFLKSVLGSNRNVVEAINRSSNLLTCDLKGCLQPNVDFLIREGVPFDGVAEFLIRDAITVQHKHNNMVNAVNDLKNLGFDPKAPVFLEAVRVRIHMSESIWKEKIEVMKSLGWSEEEIFSAFKRDLIFLKSPVEKIRVATDFFVNTLKLGRQILSEDPEFFTLKIDKSCRRRHDVFKLLESEKLIEGGVKIEEVLKMRDKEFLVKYVKKYVDKVPGLWETFNGRKQQQSLPGLTELVESREIIIDGLVKKHPPDHALPKQLKLFLMTKLCCMQNFGTDCGVDNEPMDATSQNLERDTPYEINSIPCNLATVFLLGHTNANAIVAVAYGWGSGLSSNPRMNTFCFQGMASNVPLRNLLSLVQNRSLKTSTVPPNTSSPSSFTVQYLLSSPGLHLESVHSVSQKLRIDESDLQNPHYVIGFLKAHDFKDAHIAKLIHKWPAVLHCKVEHNLKPKFEFFIENGFVGEILPELIVSNPDVLRRALDSRIIPCFELLKSVLGCSEKAASAFKRCSVSMMSAMEPNIDLLIKEGVPVDRIAKLIMLQPRTIQQKHQRMVYAVKALKDLEIDSKTTVFIHALRVMLQMSESTWNKKVEVLKSLGWTEEEILQAFKRCPFCFTCSEEKIRSVVDFLVNTLKMELRTVIGRPEFLMLSVDKRIRPRYNVLKILESKKLVIGKKNMKQLLTMRENNFFQNYVIKYADKVPEMAANKHSRSLLSLLQKRFLLTFSAALSPPTAQLPTSSSSSSSSSFTVHFLVNSCGLTSKSALSVSKKFQIRENKLQNPQSVLQFLKAHDFSETHISKLIEKRPKILLRRIEDNLKAKFDFFIENGFAGQLLPQLILSNPVILERALDSHIKPSLLYFKSILGTSEKVIAASKRSVFLLTCDWNSIVQPNVDFLIKEGVPVDRVAKLFLFHPQVVQRKHDRMVYAVNTVKDLGLEPEVSIFIYALTTMMQSSESTLKKKVEVLKSLGWTEEEIFRAFKQDPAILRFSEDKIRGVMDFLVNTVGLRPQTIIANPLFLHYSINKRLRPRYNVLKALESKKLFDEGISIGSALKMSDKKFMKNYVSKYVNSVPGTQPHLGPKIFTDSYLALTYVPIT
ncbi:hypothetical protein NC653_000510 [Populus alba x Populus x berolinensis]|uniref:Mitochondrial transcription termination factor family protein n=1 Tax=Populus alba x Populus x berolinensis TaxID=444605 RepID=A0AAD6RIS1_9ROSI|nr:hypothetical protein NC653_000510 [Populus alba x Populus x berolinensis]